MKEKTYFDYTSEDFFQHIMELLVVFYIHEVFFLIC